MTLNMSKTGGSVSFGPRCAKITVGPRGKRATAGIPGTGFYYTKQIREPSRKQIQQEEEKLKLGFFQRIFTSKEEIALVEGLKSMVSGEADTAYEKFCRAGTLPDGAYLAGFIAMDRHMYDQAASYLEFALSRHEELGTYFSKYQVTPRLRMKVTSDITACVEPDLRGVLLGLSEVYQLFEKTDEAIAVLERLRTLDPDDAVVKVSLAELLLDLSPDGKAAAEEVISFIDDVENESPAHTALMLYRARALRILNMPTAARDILTAAYRKKKNRPPELLRAVRYERALAYEDLGQAGRAKKELESIYAEDPDFEDTAERLGLKKRDG